MFEPDLLKSEEKRNCPKCGYLNSSGDVECRRCGVILNRAKNYKTKAEESRALFEQERRLWWDRVLADFNNPKLHEDYILFCRKKGYGAVATETYETILSMNPDDEMATLMWQRSTEIG